MVNHVLIVFSFLMLVRARAVPMVDLSNETTKDCAAYFCVWKNCSYKS